MRENSRYTRGEGGGPFQKQNFVLQTAEVCVHVCPSCKENE